MSLKDSRILIASYYQDFSSVNLTASTYVVAVAALGYSTKGIYIENTSGVPIIIAYGPPGSEKIADYSPINNNVEKSLIFSATMPISIKSLVGTLSTGKFLINLYN